MGAPALEFSMGHAILGLGLGLCAEYGVSGVRFRERFEILGAGCDLRFGAQGRIASCEHGL